jgi:hypothetical protein
VVGELDDVGVDYRRQRDELLAHEGEALARTGEDLEGDALLLEADAMRAVDRAVRPLAELLHEYVLPHDVADVGELAAGLGVAALVRVDVEDVRPRAHRGTRRLTGDGDGRRDRRYRKVFLGLGLRRLRRSHAAMVAPRAWR